MKRVSSQQIINMCVGMNWLLSYLFVTTLKIAVNQASLDSMKTAPDTCSIEQFVSISSLNTPASITPHPLLDSAYILGTSQGVARANSETTNFLDLQLPNTEVGGVESDSDGKVLFTDFQRYCIKSYDVTSDTEEEWAGRCGTYGDSTASSTVSDARFAQLYDLAGNSEKTLFYVNQQRSKIRVISTVDDTVELKIENMQEIYALAIAVNGDLYFAAQKSVYVVVEDSSTSHLVAGRPNQSGSNDGELTVAKFSNVYGMVHLAEYNWVIASDRQNKLLRIIDIDNNEVTSICGGSQSEGSLDDCQLNGPQGLILHGGGLVLVDEDQIKRITCPGDDITTVEQTTTAERETTTTTESETTTTTESETTTTTESETTATTESETTTTTESETTTTTESETTTTTESETTTTTENETTTTTESETTTTIEQATTTTAAPGPTMKMTAVGSRTAAGMWLEWSGTDNSTCSGTLALHFSTEQSKDCMMACVVSTNCCCLSLGNGACEIYRL